MDAKNMVDITGNVTSEGDSIVIGSAENKVTITGDMSAKKDIQVSAQQDVSINDSDISTIAGGNGGLAIQSSKGNIDMAVGNIAVNSNIDYGRRTENSK